MELRGFGKTGIEVSALGFGGAPVGYLETDRQQVSDILNTLLDRGVNLIDTAASYGSSEEAIGEAIGHRRDDYVLVSKCGQAFGDIEGEAWSASAIEQTVERALRRLKTDYIDVVLLHSCDLETLKKGEALGALVKARDAGKVREPSGETQFKQGETDMGDKGKKDKGKREQQKKAQLNLKEKRKQKKGKKK